MARRAAPNSRGFWTRVFSGVDVPDDAARQLRERRRRADRRGVAGGHDRIGRRPAARRAPRTDRHSASGCSAASRPPARSRRRLRRASRDLALPDADVDARAHRHPSAVGLSRRRSGTRCAWRPSTAGAASWPRRSFRARSRSCRAWRGSARSSVPQTQTLIEQLVALPVADDGRYAGAVARWLRNSVAAAMPRADTIELRGAAAACRGPPPGERVPRLVTWEGQPYRLDLGAAERRGFSRCARSRRGCRSTSRSISPPSAHARRRGVLARRAPARRDPARRGCSTKRRSAPIAPRRRTAARRVAAAERPRDAAEGGRGVVEGDPRTRTSSARRASPSR